MDRGADTHLFPLFHLNGEPMLDGSSVPLFNRYSSVLLLLYCPLLVLLADSSACAVPDPGTTAY